MLILKGANKFDSLVNFSERDCKDNKFNPEIKIMKKRQFLKRMQLTKI